MKRIAIFFAVILACVPSLVFAASAGIGGPAKVYVGRTFQASLRISGAENTDTVRFVGSFPADKLELIAMANGGSFPNRSPGSGFTQGTFNIGGFSLGSPVNGSVTAATLTFRAKAVGTAQICLVGGTRILSAGVDQLTGRGCYTVTIEEAPEVAPEPDRPPVEVKIEVTSPSHPDEDKWETSRELVLEWKVTGKSLKNVFYGFDMVPEGPAEIKATSSTLRFTANDDGVWYGHIIFQFTDNTSVRRDYRFMVDKTPPKPLAVAIDYTGVLAGTKNYVRYAALDDTSGIARYEVEIDGVLATTTQEQAYEITDLGPGQHTVRVRAYDRAGNSVEGVGTFTLTGALEAPRVGLSWKYILVILLIIAAMLLWIGYFLGFIKGKNDKNRKKKSVRWFGRKT